MSASGSVRIRPAGRHILTIGRDLIQDSYAAVVELVKNAYDADSPEVKIEFTANPDRDGYTLIVSDHGHGMSRDIVINRWMVPSTDDKLKRRESPAGRTMQGSKGIGRYATAVLGKDLLLETISGGEKTTLFIVWSEFVEAQFLDDVEILIETTETAESSGTRLIIRGDENSFASWDDGQFNRLRFELRKLLSPVSSVLSQDEFCIRLTVSGFPDVEDAIEETIDPYPLFELFDYKISGTFSKEGIGILTYSSQKARNIAEETIPFDLEGPTGCGDLDIDIRVYDRESEAIDSLIARGFKDNSGSYVGNLQARRLLNEYNGIGVYRNGFRIRPLGDAGFEWLKLDGRRVQNPSMRIGSNQVIGYVQIQSEDLSRLIEKSARDGLKENHAYDRLKKITTRVISVLETRRFEYRRTAGLSRPALKIERELARLFSHDGMKREIRMKLNRSMIGQTDADEIIDIISRDEEEKSKAAEEIRRAVAIYQGQATLGKIINVVLHEGRRPLNYFRNQIPNLRYWHDKFQKTEDLSLLAKVIQVADGIGQNAEFLVKLFKRLDPLAAGRRPARKPLKLKEEIEGALSVFEESLKSQDICIRVCGPDDFTFPSWSQDLYAIFTNLIDNSLYWIQEKKVCKRTITIELLTEGDILLHIDYRDTGPGIEPAHIEKELIFEPQFSTKPNGTGLGLAIAGEAAERNGLELKVFESESGAFFRLQPKVEIEE